MADWLGLPITRTEDWDDGTVVTWLAHPFPVERKPFAPSKVADEARLRKIPFDLLIATQNEVTKRGVEKHLTRHDVPPLVYLYGGRYYIADGHHRITAKWLTRHTTGDTDVLARVALVPEEYRAPIKAPPHVAVGEDDDRPTTLSNAMIDLVSARQAIARQDRHPKTTDLGDLPDDCLIQLIELFEELEDLALQAFNERRSDDPQWTISQLGAVRARIRKAEEAIRSQMPVRTIIEINHASGALADAHASALVDAKSRELLEALEQRQRDVDKWQRDDEKR